MAHPQYHVRAGTVHAGGSLGHRDRGLHVCQMALPHLCSLFTCGVLTREVVRAAQNPEAYCAANLQQLHQLVGIFWSK